MNSHALSVAGLLFGAVGICFGVVAYLRSLRAVRQCTALIQGSVGSRGTVDPRALRDVAVVRYDALNEMSGQLSFSLALLNAIGDGVVLSSINGRCETRTYVKVVLSGKGSQKLSPEEEQAVKAARMGQSQPQRDKPSIVTARLAAARDVVPLPQPSSDLSWHHGPMRYAYLGPEGTFTEAALKSLPPGPEPVEPVPCPTIQAVLGAVRDESAQRAVVPIESSVEGIVTATVDDLATGDLVIRAEVQLPITFALLTSENVEPSDVKIVGGHPQALAQCRRWLASHLAHAEQVPAASNAEAARRVAEGTLDAALAGAFAASKYGLTIAADNVQDSSIAVTRFVVISLARGEPLPAPTSADRSSLAAFLTEDHAGALMEILTEFAVRGINLTTIQSRPTGAGLGSYYFFIDCEGHVDDARVGEAMMGLRRVCRDVRFLGSYPRCDGGITQVRPGTSDQEFAEAAAWLSRLRFGRYLQVRPRAPRRLLVRLGHHAGG